MITYYEVKLLHCEIQKISGQLHSRDFICTPSRVRSATAATCSRLVQLEAELRPGARVVQLHGLRGRGDGPSIPEPQVLRRADARALRREQARRAVPPSP